MLPVPGLSCALQPGTPDQPYMLAQRTAAQENAGNLLALVVQKTKEDAIEIPRIESFHRARTGQATNYLKMVVKGYRALNNYKK